MSSPLLFDFKLSKTQEERALLLTKKNIIVDMHFGGPIIYNNYLMSLLKELISKKNTIPQIINKINQERTKTIISKKLPQYKKWWDTSGVTVGCKTVGIFDKSTRFFTFKKAIEDIGLVLLEINSLGWLHKITKYKDILDIKKKNEHGFILRLENTTQIGLDFKKIDLFYNLGIRIIQLTYNTKNYAGFGCMAKKDFGLTSFGKKLIKYLNKRKILIDVSHCGPKTTMETIRYSENPIIATHTFCKTLCEHPRGKTDEEIRYLAKKGGVIGILINPFFLEEGKISIENFLDHIDFAVRIAGIEHVGIGTDWDCTLPPILANYFNKKRISWGRKVKGYRDARDWLNVVRGLVARGYKDNQIKAIIGGNFLRVFKKVEG